jgi:hypothetical protein
LTQHLTRLGREAYLSPTVNRITVVYDNESEADYAALDALASRLSQHFACPALATIVQDSDLFLYRLYDHGQVIDEYNAAPGYYDDSRRDAPRGGDAAALCAAFGIPQAVQAVEALLQRPGIDEDDDDKGVDYLAGEDLHRELVAALGFPSFAAGIGYDGIAGHEQYRQGLPEGLDRAALVKIGS